MNDNEWDLSAFYDSFEDERLKSDYNRLVSSLDSLATEFAESFKSYDNAANKLIRFIDTSNDLTGLLIKLFSYGRLCVCINTSNGSALRLVEQIEALVPKLNAINVMGKKWIKNIPDLEKIINSNKLLKEHEFIIMENKTSAQYALDDNQELLLAHLSNTGANAWSKLQEVLTSHLHVDVQLSTHTETVPLSIARNMAYEADDEVRKYAYLGELEAYKKIDKSVAAALNSIKGEVITVAEFRGYESPLAMTLENSRMDKETLDTMFRAIDEYLPVFRKYLRKKAELLGKKDGLPFYDLFAPIGKKDYRFTYNEAQNFIISNFASFSDKLGNFAKNAFENKWIDSTPRKGKIGGAFCSSIHAIGESRILSNFTGSFSDVTTLAHELGHAYHGHILNEVSQLNSDYPMPLAETASIFCETIIVESAIKQSSPDEAFTILENSIMSTTQTVVDIYSRYMFETELFEKRKEGSLSVTELNEIMLKSQRATYGNGLSDELHPYMWLCKPHYYFPDSNFYNFPYVFGNLFAKSLYAMYQNEGSKFVSKYDNLLKATGCNSIRDTLLTIGVDSHSIDFFKGSLELIKNQIDMFCENA